MKKSIRYQYTLIFAAIITVILFSIWCVNNLFLVNFYVLHKERILKETYVQIEEMMKANPDHRIENSNGESTDSESETEAETFLRVLGEKYNMSIFVLDETTGGYWSTEPRMGRNVEIMIRERENIKFPVKPIAPTKSQKGDPTEAHESMMKNEIEILESGTYYTLQKVFDPRSKSHYLQSTGYFSGTEIFYLMSVPLSSIQESVDLSNRFLSLISLIALVFGSIIIFITTKKVATPILELSKLSEQMSNLNFDAKYEGDSVNEIGVLGNSMNVLSDKLKGTMGELKSANIKLQSDIEQKIKIDEMRKDFIANVSHELKTPITIIHGYAEGLTDGMCKDEESRDYYYRVILNESDKMAALVKQLLNLSDLEFGVDLPQIERFDLAELIRDVLTSMELLFEEKGAKIEFIPSGDCHVWADEFKIEEVLNNYLSNALNHLDGERRIEIRLKQQERFIRASVFNTGKNIPEEDIKNLWSKFYKVDKARTREYGGTGIGLSIVKAIMDSHRMECGVENRSEGVEFWFTLDRENGE